MDYKDFEKPKGKKEADPVEKAAGKPGFWWQEDDATFRGQYLSAAAEALEKDQVGRRNLNLLHARMYNNFEFLGFGARQYSRGNIAASSKITFNVVEAAIDTLAAKIAKHRPRSQTVTDGAKWSEQQKAKRLGRFIDGMFHYANIYAKNDIAFISAGVYGSGGYKVVIDDNKKVNVEHVSIDEILVDEADAKYGKPRQMIQGKLCHRETLIADYPEHRQAILDAVSPDGVEMQGFGDMVQVWEGWHLPSKKGAGDGKHSIVLEGGHELFCEPWKLDRFPFVFYHYKPRLHGFWGQGIAEILTGIQLSLNRLVQSVDEQLRLKTKAMILAPLSARIPPEHFNNRVGNILYYNGNVPPQVVNQNAVASEDYLQIDRLYQKAFQLVGASELSVSAKKPSGLNAGVALREFEDIESERFAKQHQRWDEFHIELAETMLDMVRHFGGKDYVTRYEHKRYMETITWEDVKHEPGEYGIKMLPSSSLPQTPAARRQSVQEMLSAGFIDKPTAQKLLDFPDLEAETNLANAARDDVDACIEALLDGSDFEMPDKYTNLDMFIERGTAMLLFARHHKAPEDALERLEAAIDQAATASSSIKASAAQASMAAAPPMEGAAPPIGPGAPGPVPVGPSVPPPVAVPPNILPPGM